MNWGRSPTRAPKSEREEKRSWPDAMAWKAEEALIKWVR
jgi:hypothetical protein